jgi:hypothetical protein
MRQESAFQPTVVSVSDAIGLMQMLPSTGVRIVAELGTSGAPGHFSREFLFEPRVNIRLGARYLADLSALVGVPAAFAAYNAGEHRVAEWWAGPACRGGWDLDRFVDWIPFGQTRNYVRRVTSHYLRYRYLEDPARGWPDVVLPETASGGRRCPDPGRAAPPCRSGRISAGAEEPAAAVLRGDRRRRAEGSVAPCLGRERGRRPVVP